MQHSFFSLLQNHLICIELVVKAPLLQEFLVSSVFNYIAILQHGNLIRIDNRLQTVGNYEAGPAGNDIIHGLLDLGFSNRINI